MPETKAPEIANEGTADALETSGGWNLEPLYCRHLKSKDLYMGLGFHPSGLDQSEGTPCWCMKTQQSLGPDNDLADRASCRSGRICFEPDEI